MRAKPINKLFRIIGGKPAPKGENAFCEQGTPFVKMRDLGRAHFSNNLIDIEQKVSDEIAKANGLNLIKRGSILLPRSGSVALNHRAVLGVDAYMVSHICALEVIDKKEINNLYAYYYLRSIKMDRISKKTTGLDAITFEDLGKLKIPIPPLDDQKRIAYLLGKVEGLIAQRKQHLQQLDDLLKSVFLEMFGDPVRNEKGWDTISFHKVGKFNSGGTPSKSRDDFWSGDFPWVSPKDMKVSKVEDAADHISETVFEQTSLKRITPGHLLIVVRGMILAHSFPVAINTVEIAINQDMKAIKPIKGINVVYLQNCLISLKRQILKLISTAGHGTRKLESIAMQKLFIPKPPVPLQNKFAAIVGKVEGLKSRYQQSLADLETLYGALSQKAFKGELDLSQVTIPEQKQDEAAQEMKVVEAAEESELTEMIKGFSRLDMAAISTAEGRAQILKQWFGEWLNDIAAEQELSSDNFWQRARYSALDYQGDDDASLDFSLQDYDLFKQWLFDAIAEGRIEQTRNKIKMAEKEEFGNQIVLKKVR